MPPPPSSPSLATSLSTLLNDVQRSVASHGAALGKLRTWSAQDPGTVLEALAEALQHVLVHTKRDPAVERLVSFLVAFPATQAEDLFADSSLANHLIELLLPYHNAKDKGVRFRVCQLLTGFMNSLGEDAEISDDLFERVRTAMLLRLRDKVASVRRQAVHALSRLQDPMDKEDLVTKEFVRVLSSDTNKDARKAALDVIDISQITLPPLLRRTRDVKPDVRKQAFIVLGNKVDVRAFTIEQRCALLNDGLHDRDEDVRNACVDMLCENWLEAVDRDPLRVLSLLDVEESERVATEAARVIVQRNKLETRGGSVLRRPVEPLSPESALYWRVQCEEYKDSPEILELLLPPATEFAALLLRHATKEFVLHQLLLLLPCLDFADEAGRRTLCIILEDMILSLHIPDNLVKSAIDVCPALHAGQEAACTFILGLEQKLLVLPENDLDKEGIARWMRALLLTSELLKASSQLHGDLTRLLGTVIQPAIRHPNPGIRNEGVHCLGLYCLLDRLAAQQHLLLLLQVLRNDQDVIQLTAMRILFDLFFVFGEDLFPAHADSQEDDNGGHTSPLEILLDFLGSEDQDMRTDAAEGFAKLFFADRINSPRIFSRLILLFFNPVTEDDDRLRQCLSVFFPSFAYVSSVHQTLIEEAFMPTLRIIMDAPRTSPLSKVSPSKVMQFLVQLVDDSVIMREEGMGCSSPHERLAIRLSNAILADFNGSDRKVYCRGLSLLRLDPQRMTPDAMQALKVLSENVLEEVEDRVSRNHITKFVTSLAGCPGNAIPVATNGTDSSIDTTLSSERTSVGSVTLPRPSSRKGRSQSHGKEEEEEGEEEEEARENVPPSVAVEKKSGTTRKRTVRVATTSGRRRSGASRAEKREKPERTPVTRRTRRRQINSS